MDEPTMIDRKRRPLQAGRCAHCGQPLQTVWYVDDRADIHCPQHGHQHTLPPARAREAVQADRAQQRARTKATEGRT